MRPPERHAFAHQVIGKIGRQQRGVAHSGGAGGPIHFDVPQHGREDAHGGADGVGGVEQPLLVLLQVAVVGHGQPLQQRQQRNQVADDTPALAPRQLGDVRILLLRHQRRTGRVGVGDPDEIEFAAGPQDQVLGQAREMDGEQRGERAEFHGEIPVAHRVH